MEDPPTGDGTLAQIALCDASARLEQEFLPLPCPSLTQTPRDGSQLVAVDVIEHDDVGTGRDGLIRLVFISDFDIQEKRETANFTCARDRRSDRSYPQS
jgi:hypothetical protein